MKYQFDEDGQPLESAAVAPPESLPGGISFRMIVGIALIVLGVMLGYRTASTAIGLVQGQPAPFLEEVTENVSGKIATLELDGKPVDFNLPANVTKLLGYGLCFLLLWIPLSFSLGMIRWGSGLLKSDAAELRQLLETLRRSNF